MLITQILSHLQHPPNPLIYKESLWQMWCNTFDCLPHHPCSVLDLWFSHTPTLSREKQTKVKLFLNKTLHADLTASSPS